MKDLLNPRYQLILDYPSNSIKVGTILEWPIFVDSLTKIHWCEMYDKYPHIYKKLEWFDHRTLKEMPLYLKNKIQVKLKRYIKTLRIL